ncbi:hypothetical protein UPYG_G00157130 [Umbra pygmaea]|uniref:Serine/threonine-protein kinase 31 n=1 Tax=Umbra pygmaea TaxID=75934 RepID=A0ABD0WYG5_UMBPY
MEQSMMDRENMELVGVTHIVDAITFWAQNVNEHQAIEKMSMVLAESCPTSPRLLGIPNPQKIYGSVFSEDCCWYRCKVLQQIDDKFHVSYIDYGNTEFVSRSGLVELPEDLHSPCFSKKYKFWGVQLSSDKDTPHFQQGKAFLQTQIFGKRVRIQKKSVCVDGTVLIQAFQGNRDIGEEVLKMKFAKHILPGSSSESPMSVQALQESPGLWSQWTLDRAVPNRDKDMLPVLACMPKLRPAFGDQRPQSLKEKSLATAQYTANMRKMDHEVVEENQRRKVDENAQPQSSQHTVDMPRGIRSEHQVDFQENGTHGDEDQCLSVTEQFGRLAEKVQSLRGLRECILGNAGSNSLMEAIDVVLTNRISAPVAMEKTELAWSDYNIAQEKIKSCQTKEQLRAMIDNRDKTRAVLAASVEDFLQEAKGLPVRQRMAKLEEVRCSLMTVFGPPSLDDDVGGQAFEQYLQWWTERNRHTMSIRYETDKALEALCTWSENVGKFFCLSAKTTLGVIDIVDGLMDWLKQAEMKVSNELDWSISLGKCHESKVVSDAFHKLMQHIHQEQKILTDIMERDLQNNAFKLELLQWHGASPNPEALISVKKSIRSLRSQLKWRQVEESSLEEAEDFDLTKILKKKEEIAETRKALFQEVGQEGKERMKLSALAEGSFPELPLLYPEAGIHRYMSSGGLLADSLDRDMFDAEPMRELSTRRPLVCTEFQGQRVILKSYTINEEAEAGVMERCSQFHRARTQSQTPTDSVILPLLALFFGKSDPIAYVMVPYFPNGSLGAVQAATPLTATETVKVMRGVARGLQALHSAGITHASINPNNVFILHRQQGLVGDFDFTKGPVQRAVDSGMVAGSISLVAPELRQTPGTPPSSASDMYSYGCLLLWLHAPGFSGAPEVGKLSLDVSGVKLEASLHSLLSKLLVSAGRLSAAETLTDDYFLSDQ